MSAEAKDHADLGIEKNLLLVYNKDFNFYISKKYSDGDLKDGAALKAVLEEALTKAEGSGIKKKLIDEYFSASVKDLALESRTKIPLALPAGE